LPQITDLDVDASGRLYLSAWDGAGYSGDSSKGFLVRAVPHNWEYKSFPDLEDASLSTLQELLTSGSGVARLSAQQELLARPVKKAAEAAWEVAADNNLHIAHRIAGMYTYAQIAAADAIENLLQLTEDEQMREHALRALADRKGLANKVPLAPFLE